MSNLDDRPAETPCGRTEGPGPVSDLLTGRDVVLGGPRGMKVTRTLPNRDVRMVGAWCFVDHYGPESLSGRDGMSVPPHPHTGLQTVSWLVEGEVLHRDSLGSVQVIRPGQLNLMTAGRGISHAEHSPPEDERPDGIHGVQLWVALPDESRFQAPHFEHHADLPVVELDGARAVVLLGELAGARSPAATYTPIVGAELRLDKGTTLGLALRPDFEHAVLVLSGDVEVDGEGLTPGPLLYLGTGRGTLTLDAERPSRVLLIGGEPFGEPLVMWWNFVGRDHDEIVAFREQWQAGDPVFGSVSDDGERPPVGARLPAPVLPNARLAPRPGRRK
ncbi:pirin family protein [Spongisporangium articulatum]|uniref:Pirin family protein n=1 Tax=Spongisporangium articulatum TaxID=3362603 RepID=A0ABW8AJ30_9ACTN